MDRIMNVEIEIPEVLKGNFEEYFKKKWPEYIFVQLKISNLIYVSKHNKLNRLIIILESKSLTQSYINKNTIKL
jgi:hypothetical protein